MAFKRSASGTGIEKVIIVASVSVEGPAGMSRQDLSAQHRLQETWIGRQDVYGSRPTAWHSAAASALETGFKKNERSRAKRSAAMPGWAAVGLLRVCSPNFVVAQWSRLERLGGRRCTVVPW